MHSSAFAFLADQRRGFRVKKHYRGAGVLGSISINFTPSIMAFHCCFKNPFSFFCVSLLINQTKAVFRHFGYLSEFYRRNRLPPWGEIQKFRRISDRVCQEFWKPPRREKTPFVYQTLSKSLLVCILFNKMQGRIPVFYTICLLLEQEKEKSTAF